MLDLDHMRAWAKKVGEWRLEEIYQRYADYCKNTKQEAAIKARAASTKGEGYEDD